MSILIKGVEMPKEGQAMNIEINFDGKTIVYFYGDIPGHEDEDIKIELWRRIIEVVPVPTPHGRLVDAEKIVATLNKVKERIARSYGNNDEYVNCLCAYAIPIVDNAPTVIESEE